MVDRGAGRGGYLPGVGQKNRPGQLEHPGNLFTQRVVNRTTASLFPLLMAIARISRQSSCLRSSLQASWMCRPLSDNVSLRGGHAGSADIPLGLLNVK
jgi:hypothetical protein